MEGNEAVAATEDRVESFGHSFRCAPLVPAELGDGAGVARHLPGQGADADAVLGHEFEKCLTE
ncbi:hypothetical protein ACFOY4_19570 [Actinomadura syzygii]|uniref:Uncharacterized protein n=1 Tax=Actinomadura syzygii TaxID=1427538 RepID=A0A5D0U5T8_9ACTN|nr:hypothetical protein [Actinomadura syzygii]TYC12359.1 hypothetical protein FXF65_24210 [Actinomadura syzygii]